MNIGRIERVTKSGPQVVYNADAQMKPAAGASASAVNCDVPQWPEPLAEEAFQGVAGEIVRAIEPHSEADPSSLLIQLLVAFGNIIGRASYFRVEADCHTANLFAVLVGVTSKGRKGTSWGHIRNVFEQIETGWAGQCVAEGLSSGEGLIWAVRDPIEKQQPIREKGRVMDYQTVIEDQGVADKRLLVQEAEFASLLKVMSREGNTVSPLLRTAWDKGDLRTLTKNSPARATGAHISLVAHVTREELLRHLNTTEAGNGFANRFLWVCVGRSKCLPEGGDLASVDFGPMIRRLAQASEFARRGGELRRDEDARAIWHEVYPALSEGKPGLLGGVTNRAEAQVVRLSLLYALLDCSLVIRREHLLAALAVWDYCEASARFIFGDALGYPEADKILQALRGSQEGLSRTEIRNLFNRHKSEAEIQAALTALAERGSALRIFDKTDGRPVERWVHSGNAATKATEAPR